MTLRGVHIYRFFFFFLALKRTQIRFADPQLFAQETINLSTNVNTTKKDNDCFIPFSLRMPSVNMQNDDIILNLK